MDEPTPDSSSWQDFYSSPPPPPPPQKSPVSKGKVALIAAATLVAALVGWQVVAWGLSPSSPPTPVSEKNTGAPLPAELLKLLSSPTPTPTSHATTTALQFTVVTPDKLGGRTKSTDAALTKKSSEIASGMREGPQTSVMAQHYGSQSKKNLVFAQAAATNQPPTNTLNQLIDYALSQTDIVKPLSTFDAGPLGGKAMCSEGKAKGIQVTVTVCGWVDEGSFGLLTFYYASLEKAQAEFHALRASIEQVS